MNLKILFSALILAVIGSGTANAAIISKTYAFTAESNGPISTHAGQFSYDYDTDLNSFSLTSFDFELGEYVFSMDNTDIVNFDDLFIIGGILNGVGGIIRDTYDFFFFGKHNSPMGSFVYEVLNGGISTGFVFFTEIVTPVDVAEPGTMGLIGAGVVGLGLATLRRRKAAV